jgi:predicted nucleic acid-binding protein
MYLLDTNVVSELRRTRPHGGVIAWLSNVGADQLFIAAVTFGELQAGVEMTREQDPQKAAAIEGGIDSVSAAYGVIPIDDAIFRYWAKLMHRRSNDLIEDAMIAATAVVRNLIVVTRNERDFARFDVPLLNPFRQGG